MYKYLKKEHFHGLIREGRVRIGTLKNYQSSEHGSMVSDGMEGAKRFSGRYAHLTADQAAKSHALNSILSLGEGATVTNLVMDNNVIIEPDFFIFSMAFAYSENDHMRWLEEEKYDYCYKINFPKTFFKRITSALHDLNPVKYLGVCEVHYYDEKKGMDYFDPKNSFPAFSLKDYDGFSEQKEFRAVWQPLSSNDISPINLSVESLSSYIEEHAKF